MPLIFTRGHCRSENSSRRTHNADESSRYFKVQYRPTEVPTISAHCTTGISFPFIIIFTSLLSWCTAISSHGDGSGRRSSARRLSLAPADRLTSKDSPGRYITRLVGRELIILEYIDKHFTRPPFAPIHCDRTGLPSVRLRRRDLTIFGSALGLVLENAKSESKILIELEL